MVLALISLSSCYSSFKNLPAKNNSKERQALTKSFAENFFSKCEKQDYSEITGFNMDVNLKRFFSPSKIESICKSNQEKYGKITIGSLKVAKTRLRPADFQDYFIYNMKTEKNDSVRYVSLSLTRDQDYFNAFRIVKEPISNYYKKKK